MFPHEQGPQDSSLLRRHSLPPLRSHLNSVRSSIAFQNQHIDNSRYLQETPSEHQQFWSLNQRPRGGSFEEERVYSRTMLPSMASLMPSQNSQFQHDNSTLSYEGIRSSTALVSTPSNFQVRQGLSTPFAGLSAFPIQPIEVQRNRFAIPMNSRLHRWSPYASTWMSVARGTFCDPWEDAEDQNKQQNPQRRRTSPRRRIAASKARDQAFRMQELAKVFDHFENNRIGYGLAQNNYGGPPFSTVSSEHALPMLQSPIYVNDSNTSANNRDVRYRDQRTNLGCLDRGGRQSALPEEFCVTCAGICNLKKHREHVHPHQLNDPLAMHPKEARHTKISADEIVDAAPNQSNRISLLLSDDTLRHCKTSRL